MLHEGTRRASKGDGSAASAGVRPGKPARAPSRSKSDGKRRHPGARASLPHALPFGAARISVMWHPVSLPAGTAWARPKQCPGALAGRPGRSWPRLCQDLCGRDARAPGWASSRDVDATRRVHRNSCRFVFIRGSSLLSAISTRIIRPPGRRSGQSGDPKRSRSSRRSVFP